jgi:hypothetical protein
MKLSAVSSMIAGFARKGQADDGYITTIATSGTLSEIHA